MTYLLPDSSVALVDTFLWSDPDDRLAVPSAPYRYARYALDLWWPPTSFAGLNTNVGVNNVSNIAARDEFDRDVRAKGVQCKRIITGLTKDANGNPLGSVTINAYRSDPDVAQGLAADIADGQAISDAAGQYAIGVPNTDAHYLVGYKAGATPVAGTTLDTLVGV